MVAALNAYITSNIETVVADAMKDGYSDFRDLEIDDNTYNIIKVQFRALGLIGLSEKKRQVSDKGTYWKLTPYGDNIMTQLLAIRK